MRAQNEAVLTSVASFGEHLVPRDQTRGEVFELSQRFYFEAAHTLNRAIETESSRRIHGHTYEAEITLRGTPRSEDGMICDLGIVRKEIARVKDLLDHRFLDEVADLEYATLESLCKYIQRQLLISIPQLRAVMVERRVSGDRCVLKW